MLSKYRQVVIALLFIFATQVSAEVCLNFEEALTLSAQRDPSVLMARAEEDEARAGVKEAGSLYKPQLSAFTRTGTGAVGLIDSGIQNQVGLRLSQRLIDFGDSKYARRTARHNLDSNVFDVQRAQVEAARESGFLYLGMLDALERIEVTNERLEYFTRQLDAVENALSSGGATRIDRADVAAQLADTRASGLELQFQYEQAATRLAIITGSEQSICEESDIEPYLRRLTDDIQDNDSAVLMAHDKNPSIQALEKQADSLHAAYQRERRNRLPVIDAVGIGSVSSSSSFDESDVDGRIGIDFSVPIATGGQLVARRDRASAREAVARAEVLNAKREMEEEISVVYRRIGSLIQQLESRKIVEEQNWEQFSAAEIEYSAGTRTLPDLVELRMDYEEASISRIQTQFDLQRQRLQLLVLTASLPIQLDDDV